MLNRKASDFSAALDTTEDLPADKKLTWSRDFNPQDFDPAPLWLLTLEEAVAHRALLVKRIGRFIATNPPLDQKKAARSLKKELETCTLHDPCGSLACQVCNHAAQQRYAVAVGEKVGDSLRKWHGVLLIVKPHRFPRGELDPRTMFEPLRERLMALLRKAGVIEAYGAFDISFNVHAEDEFEPHWRPYLSAAVHVKSVDRLNSVLRASLKGSKTTPHPFQVREINDPARAAAYAMRYPNTRRQMPPSGGQTAEAEHGNTIDTPLKSMQSVELALALHQIDLPQRLFVMRP